ncbi:MAG: ion transporter [Eubacterium sp.]|nr:ion transporter [Eubacterium sp.]
MKRFKRRLFEIIQLGNKEDTASRICDYLIIITIITNLSVLVIDTFECSYKIRPYLDIIEAVTVVLFIIEYIARIITADLLYPESGPVKARFRFIFSLEGLVDLLTLLPYFLLMLPAGIVAFRVLRVFRVFHLFRINAQYDAFNVVLDVLRDKKQQIFSSVILIFILMLASSVAIYSLEHDAQPEAFSNAFSGMWWSVSTLLTVGYGDIYPITILGRIFTIVTAFLGVGMVAIPTGIISAGFVERYTRLKTMGGETSGENMRYIMISVEKTHPWAGKTISKITLPSEFIFVTVIRNGEIMIANGDTAIAVGDEVVIGAIEYINDAGIQLREVPIVDGHAWTGRKIKNLDLPDETLIVSIVRGKKPIVPRGSTIIHEEDLVTICESKIKS